MFFVKTRKKDISLPWPYGSLICLVSCESLLCSPRWHLEPARINAKTFILEK